LNYIPYTKEGEIQELETKFKWQRYSHKHYESRFTKFYEGYWLPKKFGYDKRKAHYSSLILTGQKSREDALREIAKPPFDDDTAKKDFEYIASKLDISVEELRGYETSENKSYRDYESASDIIAFATKILQKLGIEKRVIQ
jgi:hypothetical protein